MTAFTDQLDSLLEEHPAERIRASADDSECEQIAVAPLGRQLAGWLFYAGILIHRRAGPPTASVIASTD